MDSPDLTRPDQYADLTCARLAQRYAAAAPRICVIASLPVTTSNAYPLLSAAKSAPARRGTLGA
jgi:hypothetical protein